MRANFPFQSLVIVLKRAAFAKGFAALIEIVPLAGIRPDRVEALLDAAFGADRFGRTAYKLRAGTQAIPHLSFAALDGETLVGTLQSWPVLVAGERVTLVGPVAVAPDVQRGGIGRLLMTHLMETADSTPMMMIGDPEYYGRFFGFAADVTGGWELPGPVERHRLLAKHVRAGLAGTVGPDLRALAA